MDSLKKQIDALDRCCEDAKSSQYVLATTKIRNILKCIVSNPKLYMLFNEMTKTDDFDYVECCRRCLITENNGLFSRSYVSLPDNPDECLPFIFCLLTEFDRDDYQGFNDFLRKYFNEDGTYTSCYENFCRQIIDTLKDIIDSMYAESVRKSRADHLSGNVYTSVVPDAASVPAGPGASAQVSHAQAQPAPAPQAAYAQPQASAAPQPAYAQPAYAQPQPQAAPQPVSAGAATVSNLIADEHLFVAMADIPEGDKKGALGILDELDAAIKAGAYATANALICGYNYFALFHNKVSDTLPVIIRRLYELEA